MRILIKGHIIIDSNIYICHPISSKVIYLAEQEDENNYDVVITGDLHVEEIDVLSKDVEIAATKGLIVLD